MSAIVDKIKQRIAAKGIQRQTAESRAWLQNNVRRIVYSNTRPAQLKDPDRLTIKPMHGRMYMFLYDPKLKNELPYYDRFPLIFVIRHYPDGFLGLNLHYLSPKYRLKLFAALLDFVNNDKYNNRTKLRLTWRVLSTFGKSEYAKVCVKRYLYDHLRSKFVVVPPDEWEIAVLLPSEKFKTKNKLIDRNVVWSQTRKKVL